MKTLNMIFSLLLFLLMLSPVSMAQNPYSCPDNASHPMNDSFKYMEYLAKSDQYESYRAAYNINHLKNYPIELLSGSSYSCYRLNNFRSQEMNSFPDTDYTYYKVLNYYFMVIWHTVNTTKYVNIYVFDSNYNIHSGWLF